MKEKKDVKERIIEVTTALIEQSDGDLSCITARKIAQQAEVGLGLINYHFGNKENLIATCVQRIIGKVVRGFRMEGTYATDRERLIACAAYVFQFLFDNPAISRISILSDLQNYEVNSNSVYTQKGFAFILQEEERDKAFLTFVLTAAIQVAFLGNETVKELLGYDFTKETDRVAYITKLVTMLLPESREEENE